MQYVDWGQTALAIQQTKTKLAIYMKLFLRGFSTAWQTVSIAGEHELESCRISTDLAGIIKDFTIVENY